MISPPAVLVNANTSILEPNCSFSSIWFDFITSSKKLGYRIIAFSRVSRGVVFFTYVLLLRDPHLHQSCRRTSPLIPSEAREVVSTTIWVPSSNHTRPSVSEEAGCIVCLVDGTCCLSPCFLHVCHLRDHCSQCRFQQVRSEEATTIEQSL